MRMRFIGGMLLVIGTAVGGGMLALPLATSPVGFINSSLILFGCWFVMTAGSLLILEVNLWLPTNSNLISMARKTLGKSGALIAWVTYLLLLYSLLAAYMAGGGDLLNHLLLLINLQAPRDICIILFTVLLGNVVFRGIRAVDYTNRCFMLIKVTSLFFLLTFLMPHVQIPELRTGEFHLLTGSITIAITSFGFATIVPSLREYFNEDVKKLRLAVLLGSLIPLFLYIAWDMVVMGTIPRDGQQGLIAMLHSGSSTSDFVKQLSLQVNSESVTSFARIFTSVCLFTSFLGVALCLSDFLADGFKLQKMGKNNLVVNLITFLPPLSIVLVYPGAFIAALSYAGIYCIILLVLMPALMAWRGRYHLNLRGKYQVAGGKYLLILLMIFSVLIIIQSLLSMIK